MKNKKSLFRLSAVLVIVLLTFSGNLYSQKLKIKIDPYTGDTIYVSRIIRCVKGSLGSTYYYCYLQRQGDTYELQLEISREMSNPFAISNDKPMVFILANDTLLLYPKNISESKSTISGLGLMYMFDKESSQDYHIDLEDIEKLRDDFFVKAKIYYESEQRLNGTPWDDDGKYFNMEWRKMDKKALNKKLKKRIKGILEAE
ncbi:MAG: hypothetical protein K8R74_16465 [Bacteroidales bacterium]|nr:hypothetical protein [Bacteroidales bacterium]